jgi:hypothetical protein
MKPIVIISLITLSGAGIGLLQQGRLTSLTRESGELTHEVSVGSSSEKFANHLRPRAEDSLPAAKIAPHKSVAELAAQVEDVVGKVDARFQVKRDKPMTAEERAVLKESLDLMRKEFSAINFVEILELIHLLESLPELPGPLYGSSVRTCVEILTEVNPRVLLDLVPNLKDYPSPDKVIYNAFNSWLRTSPAAAVKWFDDESQKGNPVTRSSGVLGSVILEEIRLNPAHALSRALSQQATDDPQSTANLGASIAETLDEADQNLAFFSALRQQMEKSPDSAVLAKIRRDYVDQLSRRFYQWPFASAVALLDINFTADEKAVAAKSLYQGVLDEPEKWATWVMSVVPTAGGEPPLNNFFNRWFHIDATAATKWLEQTPPGELKDQLMARYAAELPGGQ